jgi:TonB family protein
VTYLGPSLRRTRKRARPWARTLVAVAISLLANALLLREARVGVLVPRRIEPARPVSLAPLSASEWEANRRAAGASPQRQDRATPPPVAVAPLPPPPPPKQAPGQVVDVAPSKDSTPPKDSRFVSERNNRVEKETRSRHAKSGYENTAPVPTDPKAARPERDADRDRQQLAGGEGGREAAAQPQAERKGQRRDAAQPGAPDQPARDKLALAPSRDGELRLREPEPGSRGVPGPSMAPAPPSSGNGREGDTARPGKVGPPLSLHPSASTYDRIAGGPAPDHLSGVEEGEGTYLNTREWKYAGYFNRVKQAVANQWHPDQAMQLRDPSGERFSYKERVTLVWVRLDDSGGLKDVSVQKSSGVDFLDHVAVEAFKKAQPFVNPPRGLADDHGEIAFSFGFIIEPMTGGFRIFRGPSLPH